MSERELDAMFNSDKTNIENEKKKKKGSDDSPMEVKDLAVKEFKKPWLNSLDQPAIIAFLRAYKEYVARKVTYNGEHGTKYQPSGVRACIARWILIQIAEDNEDDPDMDIMELSEEMIKAFLNLIAEQKMPEKEQAHEVKSALKEELVWDMEFQSPLSRAGFLFSKLKEFTANNKLEDFFDQNENNRKLRATCIVDAVERAGQHKLAKHFRNAVFNGSEGELYLTNMRAMKKSLIEMAKNASIWCNEATSTGKTNSSKREDKGEWTTQGRARKRLKSEYSKRPNKLPWGNQKALKNHSDDIPRGQRAQGDRPVAKNGCLKCQSTAHFIKDCPQATEMEKSRLVNQYRHLRHGRNHDRVMSERKAHREQRDGMSGRDAARMVSERETPYADAVSGMSRLNLQVENSKDIPKCLDSGCTHTLICKDMLMTRIVKDNVNVRTKVVEMKRKEYTQADGHNILTCDQSVNLTLHFTTVAGRVTVRHVEAHVTNEALPELLVGKEVLAILGVDPEENLKILINDKSNKSTTKVVDMHDIYISNENINNKKGKTKRVSFYNDGEDVPLCESVGEGEGDPTPFTKDQQMEVDAVLKKMVDEAEANGLPKEQRPRLEQMLLKNKRVWRMSVGLQEAADVEPMEIRLKPGAEPVRCKSRRYPQVQAEFMREHVGMLEQAGLVYKNPRSAYASPAVVVEKAGGGKRLVVDFRAVNEQTVGTAWPMPIQETLSRHLQGSTCYSLIDMFKGYWQIGLKEDSQEVLSFQTDTAVYTPRRMLQGTKNGTNVFQAAMEQTLSHLINKGVLCWVDDLLVYADTPEQLMDRLDEILELLGQRKFQLSASKCQLFVRKAKWCGKIISAEGISHDPERIKALTDMGSPQTAADLQQFLCAMNWMRTSLPDYVRVAAPLQEFLELALSNTVSRKKRDAKKVNLQRLGWGKKQHDAFQKCKDLLLNAVTLAHPDPKQMFCLFTDASEHSWGSVLTQVPEEDLDLPFEEQRHTPLQFLGGSFNQSKRNWHILEKEAFALVESCMRLEHLLLGDKGFRIFTDHRNLLFLFDPTYRPASMKKYTEAKLERWAMKLHAFPFSIEHIPGEENVWADLISRWGSVDPPCAISSRENAPAHKQSATETADLVNVAKNVIDRANPINKALDSADVMRASIDDLAVSTRLAPAGSNTRSAGRASSVTSSAGWEDEQPEKTDNVATDGTRLRVAQCFSGVRPLQQEGFVWPDLDEIKSVQQKYLSTLPNDGYEMDEDGAIRLKNNRLWIPNQAVELQTRLIIIAHSGMAGHRGINSTLTAVASRFIWRGMSKDVQQQCLKCLHCVTTRGGKVIPRPLGSAIVATDRNEVLHFDFLHMSDLGDDVLDSSLKKNLDNLGGFEYTELLVLKCGFAHFCDLIPCRSADTTVVVEALLNWFSRYGVVNTWVSDQGSHFKNKVVADLKERLGAEHHFTLAYCPWSNGTIERANRDILAIFQALLSELRKVPREWPQLCPLVQSAINHTPVATLNNMAPVTVFTGLPHSNPLDAVYFPKQKGFQTSPTGVNLAAMAEKLGASLRDIHKGVTQKKDEQRASLKRKFDENSNIKQANFDIGDYVLMAKTFSGVKRSKLSARWYGPMQIVGTISPWVYEVKNLLTEVIQKAHVSHLKFYHDPSLDITEEIKLQLAHDGAGYEVEQFQQYQLRAGRWELQVKWLGFDGMDSTTWEPLLQLYQDVPVLVRRYLRSLRATAITRRDCDRMLRVLKKKFPTISLGEQ